jgi:hypothetical protein
MRHDEGRTRTSSGVRPACAINSLAFGEPLIEDWIELFEAGDAVQVVD